MQTTFTETVNDSKFSLIADVDQKLANIKAQIPMADAPVEDEDDIADAQADG